MMTNILTINELYRDLIYLNFSHITFSNNKYHSQDFYLVTAGNEYWLCKGCGGDGLVSQQ